MVLYYLFLCFLFRGYSFFVIISGLALNPKTLNPKALNPKPNGSN